MCLLRSLAASIVFLAAAIAVKAIGEGLYGTGDWPGVGWPTALARVGGFGVASVVLAWVAIIRRAERVPIVFFVALVLPILLVLNDVSRTSARGETHPSIDCGWAGRCRGMRLSTHARCVPALVGAACNGGNAASSGNGGAVATPVAL